MPDTTITLTAPFDNHFMLELMDGQDPDFMKVRVMLEQAQAYIVRIDGVPVKYEDKLVVYVYGKAGNSILQTLVRMKQIKYYEKFSGKDPIVLSLPQEA